MNDIVIKGAKVHNLRGVDVTIPRNSLTVITGLSGSGKSSLAFDTLYAEGQRRYVESLSAYARQFLDRMEKPDVEKIEGLSPAISIEQHTTSGNPRSIVGTVTEIHDYLRILYGSLAVAHCPKCGKPVTRQSAQQIVDILLGAKSTNRENVQRAACSVQLDESSNSPLQSKNRLIEKSINQRIILYAPVVKGKKGRHEEVFAALKRNGFVRVRVDGAMYELDEPPELDKKKSHSIDVVIDRLVIPCDRTRITDSVELALKTGKGVMSVEFLATPQSVDESTNRRTDESTNHEETFSELNACVDCGLSFDELKPRSFSFNSPFGACPTCGGLGQLYFFDEDLVVPDKTLPLEEAIHPWRRLGGQMAILYHKELLSEIARQNHVSLSTPYEKLPAKFRHDLMHGFKEDLVLSWRRVDKPFEGVLAAMKRKLDEAEDDEVRAKYEAYQNFKTCPDCHGERLNEFARAATVAGKTLTEVMAMPIGEAKAFFDSSILRFLDLPNSPQSPNSPLQSVNRSIGQSVNSSLNLTKLQGLKDIVLEITRRLQFLLDVGLDYLTLDRQSATLSGGEMQRIRLATQIGSGLTGVLYVLDEPTIGLHPRDNERLIATLKGLRDRGNTVVIVEHDEEMMRAADYIVDLGPGAGREGGLVMYQGDFKGLLKAKSLTADYLSGRKSVSRFVEIEKSKNRKFDKFLTVSGATAHNLKNVTAKIPIGSLTVVTGVSGSGKSSLVYDTMKPLLDAALSNKSAAKRNRRSDESTGRRLPRLTGAENFDKVIEIDQSPIGRTPRSNPATYVGFFSEIRELFAKTESAKARGYTAGRFSFNVKGGRCETCGGDGVQKLEMSFLPDVYVTCEECGGKRFNSETLEVTYGGKNISEVLEMTVAEACEFFAKIPSLKRKLQTLADVGLGYLGLGQAATTLSGGEAQRIKLATELSKRSTGKTLYLLDEPTTGLHFDDIAKLMDLLLKLRDAGNTVIVIEHNIDVMRCADWLVDMGPEGGDKGGTVVCEGPVEKVKACGKSYTGRFL